MNDPKTTITAVLTILAFLGARYGFHLPVDVQIAIVTLGTLIFSHHAADKKDGK